MTSMAELSENCFLCSVLVTLFTFLAHFFLQLRHIECARSKCQQQLHNSTYSSVLAVNRSCVFVWKTGCHSKNYKWETFQRVHDCQSHQRKETLFKRTKVYSTVYCQHIKMQASILIIIINFRCTFPTNK